MGSKPPSSLAGKLAELVGKLVGRPVQPAPAYAPATVRRPRPVRVPTDWR